MENRNAFMFAFALAISAAVIGIAAFIFLISTGKSPPPTTSSSSPAKLARQSIPKDVRPAIEIPQHGKRPIERAVEPSLPNPPQPPTMSDDHKVQTGPTKENKLVGHPWWKGVVTQSNIDGILDEITGHGSGFVFFNQTGKGVWVGSIPGARGFYDVHNLGAHTYEAVKELGNRRKVVPIRAGLGKRLSRSEAENLLNDCLNIPDFETMNKTITKQQTDIFEGLKNQKGIPD